MNEKRLIDVNDVYSLFDKDGFATLHVTDIDTIPMVDAVEVVRCKNCKYHKDTSVPEYKYCCMIDKTVWYNAFCYYGELVTTVDTVEFVRCRECKYFGVYKYSWNGYCTNNNGYGFPNQKPDDFCSRGERKDNA